MPSRRCGGLGAQRLRPREPLILGLLFMEQKKFSGLGRGAFSSATRACSMALFWRDKCVMQAQSSTELLQQVLAFPLPRASVGRNLETWRALTTHSSESSGSPPRPKLLDHSSGVAGFRDVSDPASNPFRTCYSSFQTRRTATLPKGGLFQPGMEPVQRGFCQEAAHIKEGNLE